MTESDRPTPLIARRQLLVGAAWSVPVVAAAVATPLAAASAPGDPNLNGVEISTLGHVEWTGFQWEVLIIPVVYTAKYGTVIENAEVALTVSPGADTELFSATSYGDTGRGWTGTGTGTFTNINVWPGDSSTGFLTNTIQVIFNPTQPNGIGFAPVVTASPSGIALIGSGWSE